MKPYYYVLRKNGQPPTVRHATLALAVTEAERLANQHPGETFEILKAVAESRVQGPASTFFMDGEGEVSLDDLAREGYDAHTRNLGARNACPPARPSGYPVFPSLDRLAQLAEADAYKIAKGKLAEAKQKCEGPEPFARPTGKDLAIHHAELACFRAILYNATLGRLAEAKQKCEEVATVYAAAYANRANDRAAFRQALKAYNDSLLVFNTAEGNVIALQNQAAKEPSTPTP